MSRLGSVCVAFAGVLMFVSAARAEETLPGGATIRWDKFLIFEDLRYKEPTDEDARRRYLNLAHCECARENLGMETSIQYEVTLEPRTTTGTGAPVEVWVGTKCDDDELRPTQCAHITAQDIADVDDLATGVKTIELNLFDVIGPNMDNTGCDQREGDAFAWLLVDTDGDNTYNYVTNQTLGKTTATPMAEKRGIDTKPPPLPTGFDAESSENAIVISWDQASGNETDIKYYQALCMDEDGNPVTSAPPSPRYQTTVDVCGVESPLALTASMPSDTDGSAVTEVPPEFARLDPDYLCKDVEGGAVQSLTIADLPNDKEYKVALLAIDYSGNVVGTYFTRTLIPRPVVDFWEDLQDRNSPVEGGCLLATTYGEGNPLTTSLRAFRDRTLARTAFGRALTRAYYATIGTLGPAVEGSLALRVLAAVLLAPLVVLALLWHALTLPGLLLLLLALPWLWRRRQRLALHRWLRRLAPAALALAVLAPAAAHANDFVPYWEDDAAADDALGADYGEVKWHVGVRVGAYIPEIDLQAGLNAITGKGPYEAMFGDYYTLGDDNMPVKHEQAVWQILPMLDVDYIVWSGFGQLGVGGSLGYMQKSAYAYAFDPESDEDDEVRIRSTASRNKFRLIPMAATVTYRFTVLDDLYGVPIIPYVRGGLSYYAWWVTAPNGNYARYCEGSTETMCDENKARGGSLGFQGSIGLAIRAERIDADAARSMRSSGIKHAGFYGEFQYAKVDGFGDETKLSVGDNTWFAGVNFEF